MMGALSLHLVDLYHFISCIYSTRSGFTCPPLKSVQLPPDAAFMVASPRAENNFRMRGECRTHPPTGTCIRRVSRMSRPPQFRPLVSAIPGHPQTTD